jgi:hypothetical protein
LRNSAINMPGPTTGRLYAPPVLDPESGQPTNPAPGAPSYLPFAAYPIPTAPPPPPTPTWTRAYEVPTARRVVSSGLQLVLDATSAIRRGSIYIGLLALGAFGPAVLLLLLGIGRLMSDPATAATMAKDPTLVFLDQPEIMGPLALIYVLVFVGLILLIAISVDAQAIAISILGGRASDRPVRLWEAITRARQVFWRLAGAGFLVGIASTIVSLLLTLPFIRPADSNTGISFIASAVATLVVSPFAFAATGIVLGDVGAVEALRRSMALFRARPRIAIVVTLFTLVTSAIQSFALGAGLDIAVRVGGFMHLSLDQGGVGLILPAILVLAFVVAFGSLTFTIAAIVAAPQVTGFLGLTYYSGGLDRARTPDGVRPRRFRWVSVPMLLTMIGLLALAGFGLPSISGFQPRAAGPILTFLRTAAEAQGEKYVSALGTSTLVDDPAGDMDGDANGAFDIVSADYGYLPEVPSWLLATTFDCQAENVACGNASPRLTAYDEGAYIFLERMAAPPGSAQDYQRGEWGPVLALPGYDSAGTDPSAPFSNASHAFVTHVSGHNRSVSFVAFNGTTFVGYQTYARSTWIGDDLITIVPVRGEIQNDPVRWGMHAALVVENRTLTRDSVRLAMDGGALRVFAEATVYVLFPSVALPT